MSSPIINAVDFYWRPGCGFCSSLDRAMKRNGIPMAKHNIWDSPDDANIVRAHANGNETVPTVIVDGLALVNPSVDEVITVLSEKAPHLVPDGWTPPQPSKFQQKLRGLLGG